MVHLVSRRVIHRDLAARNILVGVDGLQTVKLSDVGLSRPLNAAQYYRRSTNGKVPAKWLSVENIADNHYSHASDVWSFGVLCWEVFSLGEDPYPGAAAAATGLCVVTCVAGMTAEGAVRAVLQGYRMPRPSLCPAELYVWFAAGCV